MVLLYWAKIIYPKLFVDSTIIHRFNNILSKQSFILIFLCGKTKTMPKKQLSLLLFKSNQTFQNKTCKFCKYCKTCKISKDLPSAILLVLTSANSRSSLGAAAEADTCRSTKRVSSFIVASSVQQSSLHSAPALQVPLKSALYSPLDRICKPEVLGVTHRCYHPLLSSRIM